MGKVSCFYEMDKTRLYIQVLVSSYASTMYLCYMYTTFRVLFVHLWFYYLEEDSPSAVFLHLMFCKQ